MSLRETDQPPQPPQPPQPLSVRKVVTEFA